MSAVIKSGLAFGVRSFSAPVEVVAEVAMPDPREEAIAALQDEVARLTRTLAEAKAQAAITERAAREAGRREGARDAESREDDRAAALSQGLTDARADFDRRLATLDGVAAGLAKAALAKLFDAPERWSDMVQAMLARQFRTLGRSAVVAISVSPEDFTPAGEIEALSASLGGVSATLDDSLAAGASRIACRLGEVELDAAGQWRQLAQLLDAMAEATER